MTTRKRRNPQSASLPSPLAGPGVRGKQARSRKTKRQKRGIVLLVVVSLLAIFILMGVAFAIVAMHYQKTADRMPSIQRYGDPAEREFELVMDQLLFDTLGRSSLRFHSLLNDLYGGDTIAGALTASPTAMDASPYTPNSNQQPQVWQFTATPAPGVTFHRSPGYYSGRVLTFLTGNAAGHSTRVLEYTYDPASGLGAFAVEAIESKGPLNLEPNYNAVAALNSTFIVNGAPFNGAGAGFAPGSGDMTATYAGSDGAGGYLAGNLIALLPHFAGYDAAAGSFSDAVNAGGVDETWDTPDYQNMYLAMVPPTAWAGGVPIIPSFHRPELVNFWYYGNMPSDVSVAPHNAFTNPLLRNFLRTFIFRPMPWDHMNASGSSSFSGSNPAFDYPSIYQAQINGGASPQQAQEQTTQILIDNLINSGNGPIWDVDNDNDGVPDSIWIDPGLPVVTRPDGRRYKRLVAICIKDLDGRINLNAHGNGSQVATDSSGYYSYRAEYQVPYNPPPGNFGLVGAVSYTAANIPRGIGFGPAEVDFLHVFATPSPNYYYEDVAGVATYTALLQARYASNRVGPGPDGTLGNMDDIYDTGGTAAPGIPGFRDPHSYVKHHGIPNNYSGQFSWYASPPDVWGRGAIALDYGGQPRTTGMGMLGEITDCPYELSLSGEENGTDSPYTLVELERMLRYHDQDVASIPSRPLILASAQLAASTPGVAGPDEALRNLFTVHSSHIPSPAAAVPREARAVASASFGATLLDIYYQRIRAVLAAAPYNMTDPNLTTQTLYEIRKMAPWELLHGQKLDLNRWLGDGFDSNGDGTPDDYVEATAPEGAWQAPASFTGVAAQHTNSFDMNGTGAADPGDNLFARQLYAQHLYCLAMQLVPGSLQEPPITPSFDPQIPQDASLGLPAQRRNLTIRRLAQWAINCAEFRDADSIMTPFEYDTNPTNGWQVDGNPATDGTMGYEERIWDPIANSFTSLQTSERGLVWGMEYPDLLINETIALHDRRVKDTNQASDGTTPDYKRTDTPPDDDLDQFRVPQGSLFVELYCPRNNYARNPLLPRELYDVSVPTNPRLNLAKMDGAGTRPVWRLAISELTKDETTDADHNRQPFRMLSQGNREIASLEPAPSDETLLPPGLGGSPGNSLPLERFVWFTDAAAAGIAAPEINNIFYNRSVAPLNTPPLVEPGQYVFVGPRPTTYLGSQDPNNDAPDSGITYWGGNSQQSITITPTSVVVTDTAGTTTSPTFFPAPGATVRAAVGIVADQPTTPTAGGVAWGNPWTVGMNITEPLPNPNVYAPTANYYREPAPSVAVSAAGADRSFYDDPQTPINDGTGFKDEPEEAQTNAGAVGRPIYDRDMQQTGTYLECASVFLQRLANPNLPYNPAPGTNRYNASPSTDPYVAYNPNLPVNPYITVDWAGLDATVFTGEENTNQTVPDPFDPDDPSAGRPNGGRPTLPRQRGYQPTAGTPDANFWDPDANTPDNMPIAGTTNPYFRFDLAAPAPPSEGQTLGFLNATVGTPLGAPYLGESDLSNPPAPGTRQTSPWLAWHNRPFSNPMELLLVPSSSPSRICSELTPGPLNAFNVPGAGGVYDAADQAAFRAPFGHLLNLFHTADQAASPSAAAQLCRLLDYVEVPSPYLGAERWFHPAHFTAAGTYRPPFNKVSRFRDPGRININTIFDQRVFYAAAGGGPIPGFPMLADRANDALMSRQGYGNAFLAMNPAYPTRFANPFRTADASDMMPNVPAGAGSMQKNRPVDATLMRPEPNPADAASFGDDPLFAMDWRTASDAHHNTERNPYFRHQGLQKIGSTFSTTSNVFAVWMTVGYFEVEDNLDSTGAKVIDAAHPDGLRLGQEVGVDSGEVVRHRSFYIIDRSVPVGFQPGQKLNTDDCILLRRLIE